MNSRKELSVDSKNLKTILVIVFTPILFTFFIEHFGKFNYLGYGGVTTEQFRVNTIVFKTILGNELKQNVENLNIGYNILEDHSYELNPSYSIKFQYYVKALFADKILPISLILIGLIFYFIKRNFNIKIV